MRIGGLSLALLSSLGQVRSLRLWAGPEEGRSLRERRRDRRRSSLSPAPAPVRENSPPETSHCCREETACFDVLSLPGLTDPSTLTAIEGPHIHFLGWHELFPGSGLDEAFHGSAAFRSALRRAAREDFVRPLSLRETDKRRMVEDDAVSVQASWRTPNDFESISRLLVSEGVRLTGQELVGRLASLCGSSDSVFGSWIDIVGVRGRPVAHSWHQDSGLDQCTVMVGFPPSDGFEGPGVFSHAVKLSHRLPPPTLPGPRLLEGGFAEELVVRPCFGRGREVMVYDDREVFHSAPDFARRESIWRLM